MFVPGGIFLSTFRPYITMSQNMLPFDYEEILKFNFSKRIKFFLIKIFQLRTFKQSKGIIFLTKYAQNTIFKSGNFDYKMLNIYLVAQRSAASIIGGTYSIKYKESFDRDFNCIGDYSINVRFEYVF